MSLGKNKSGKLIVIEGTDGAGKATQLALLADYFKKKNKAYEILDFPQYDKTFFGKWIGRFLNGEFGSLEQIPSYLLAFPYAADRWQAKAQIDQWLKEGKMVLTNRYAPSNAVYQAAKLPEEKRQAFIDWVFEMEYEVFKIPREDTVLFLHVPYSESARLIEQKKERQYLQNGNHKDLHEQGGLLLQTVEKLYVLLSKRFPHWATIECSKNGRILSKEDIHQKIITHIS